MSDDWVEEAALRFEGFTEAEITQVKAALPKLQTLVALAQKNQADINQATALAKELMPILHDALPKVQTLIGLVDKNQTTINQANALAQQLTPTLNLVINKLKDRLS
jgi:hypothetical protein